MSLKVKVALYTLKRGSSWYFDNIVLRKTTRIIHSFVRNIYISYYLKITVLDFILSIINYLVFFCIDTTASKHPSNKYNSSCTFINGYFLLHCGTFENSNRRTFTNAPMYQRLI